MGSRLPPYICQFCASEVPADEDCKCAVKQKEAARILDSGQRQAFSSGAVRDCQVGKGRMDLLPMRALMEISKHFEAGAEKYEARNWEKGINLSRYADSAMRHFAKFMIGQTDEPHLLAACWNMLCLLDTQLRIREGSLPQELDDIPIQGQSYIATRPAPETLPPPCPTYGWD